MGSWQATGTLILPVGQPPTERVLSRFLAKAGVEAVAFRLLAGGQSVDEIVDNGGFEAVRAWARRGDPNMNWPVSIRRTYEAERIFTGEDGVDHQVLHEYHLLLVESTEGQELYFVLAILGIEFALDLARPNIAGYERWLSAHGGRSPLYPEEQAIVRDEPANPLSNRIFALGGLKPGLDG